MNERRAIPPMRNWGPANRDSLVSQFQAVLHAQAAERHARASHLYASPDTKKHCWQVFVEAQARAARLESEFTSKLAALDRVADRSQIVGGK